MSNVNEESWEEKEEEEEEEKKKKEKNYLTVFAVCNLLQKLAVFEFQKKRLLSLHVFHSFTVSFFLVCFHLVHPSLRVLSWLSVYARFVLLAVVAPCNHIEHLSMSKM